MKPYFVWVDAVLDSSQVNSNFISRCNGASNFFDNDDIICESLRYCQIRSRTSTVACKSLHEWGPFFSLFEPGFAARLWQNGAHIATTASSKEINSALVVGDAVILSSAPVRLHRLTGSIDWNRQCSLFARNWGVAGNIDDSAFLKGVANMPLPAQYTVSGHKHDGILIVSQVANRVDGVVICCESESVAIAGRVEVAIPLEERNFGFESLGALNVAIAQHG